jgi:transcriptional regulator with XRE-family HTH domain
VQHTTGPHPPGRGGWSLQLEALGTFIRHQRRVADLSLRELADLTSVSNAYLSQVERGLHQPSLKVLSAIAAALEVSPASLLIQAGLLPEQTGPASFSFASTEEAIRADGRLADDEKDALVAVYRSYLARRLA